MKNLNEVCRKPVTHGVNKSVLKEWLLAVLSKRANNELFNRNILSPEKCLSNTDYVMGTFQLSSDTRVSSLLKLCLLG